jgi:hypothetical protein
VETVTGRISEVWAWTGGGAVCRCCGVGGRARFCGSVSVGVTRSEILDWRTGAAVGAWSTFCFFLTTVGPDPALEDDFSRVRRVRLLGSFSFSFSFPLSLSFSFSLSLSLSLSRSFSFSRSRCLSLSLSFSFPFSFSFSFSFSLSFSPPLSAFSPFSSFNFPRSRGSFFRRDRRVEEPMVWLAAVVAEARRARVSLASGAVE